MQKLGSHRTEFHEIWYLRIFWKSVEKIQVSLKVDKSNGCFTGRPIYIYENISLSSSQNEKCSKAVKKKIKTHFMFSNIFPKIVVFMNNVERKKKHSRTGHRWSYNTAHALCMLDKQGYKHTLRTCYTYWFSTATTVTWTRLNVAFIRTPPTVFTLICTKTGHTEFQ